MRIEEAQELPRVVEFARHRERESVDTELSGMRPRSENQPRAGVGQAEETLDRSVGIGRIAPAAVAVDRDVARLNGIAIAVRTEGVDRRLRQLVRYAGIVAVTDLQRARVNVEVRSALCQHG